MTTPSHEQIIVPVEDGSTISGYLAQPAAGHAQAAVIVLHQLFAVSPDLRSVVDDLAAAGHLAVALELYHRHAPPGRWFPRDDDGRAAGLEQLHQLTREQVLLDVGATIAALRTNFGATQVVLYGGWLTGTQIALSRPEPTISLTGGISGRLVYLVGSDDALIASQEREAIGPALTEAGIDHDLVTYPGSGTRSSCPTPPRTPRTPGNRLGKRSRRRRRFLSHRGHSVQVTDRAGY